MKRDGGQFVERGEARIRNNQNARGERMEESTAVKGVFLNHTATGRRCE